MKTMEKTYKYCIGGKYENNSFSGFTSWKIF